PGIGSWNDEPASRPERRLSAGGARSVVGASGATVPNGVGDEGTAARGGRSELSETKLRVGAKPRRRKSKAWGAAQAMDATITAPVAETKRRATSSVAAGRSSVTAFFAPRRGERAGQLRHGHRGIWEAQAPARATSVP